MEKKKSRNEKRKVLEAILSEEERPSETKSQDTMNSSNSSGEEIHKSKNDCVGGVGSKDIPSGGDVVTQDSQEKKNDTQKNDTTTSTTCSAWHAIRPPLSPGILSAVATWGFTTLTPVQQAVLPLFLTHKDVCVRAVTGSGKTLAFCIPLVEMLLRAPVPLQPHQVGALVLSPTRELARQTSEVVHTLCVACAIPPPLLLTGGQTSSRTDDAVRFSKLGSDVVVATPGRLDDVLSSFSVPLDVSTLECLVLDEADVLLDLGFGVTLTNILARLPKMRRTGLFSATNPNSSGSGDGNLKALRRAGLRNPVVVDVSQTTKTSTGGTIANDHPVTPLSLTNYYVVTPLTDKLSHLVHFFQTRIIPQRLKCLCFVLTCAHVEFYERLFNHLLPRRPVSSSSTNTSTHSHSYYIEPLHGKKHQLRREKALARFRECDTGILLCTDVAARGLDVPRVDWVVQLDAPTTDPSGYVHRVGRAARAGRKGQSLLYLGEREESYVDLLRGRRVEVKEWKSDDGSESESYPDVLPRLRKELILKDRDALEKGTKAFTSHVRAYKEHQCAFIFRFASLDLGQLATAFLLLRLPKMPELKTLATSKSNRSNNTFTPAGREIDITAIPFLDKVRERARQARLAQERASGVYKKRARAEEKKLLQTQREAERIQQAQSKGYTKVKNKGRNQRMHEEWDELGKEERLYKKLKRGKINREEYGRLMYGDDKKKKAHEECESDGSGDEK